MPPSIEDHRARLSKLLALATAPYTYADTRAAYEERASLADTWARALAALQPPAALPPAALPPAALPPVTFGDGSVYARSMIRGAKCYASTVGPHWMVHVTFVNRAHSWEVPTQAEAEVARDAVITQWVGEA